MGRSAGLRVRRPQGHGRDLETFRHAMDYQVDPAWDWIRNLLWLEVGVYLIAAILTFFLSYRRASSPHLRRQLRVVNIGTLVGLTPFVVLLILAVATNFQAFDPRWLVLSTLGLPFYSSWPTTWSACPARSLSSPRQLVDSSPR